MSFGSVHSVRLVQVVDGLTEGLCASLCANENRFHGNERQRKFLPSFWAAKFINAKHLLAALYSNDIDRLFVDSVKHSARRDYQLAVREIWNLRRNGPHPGEQR